MMVDEQELGRALHDYCNRDLGVVENQFLCQPVSSMGLETPICVQAETPMKEVMLLLRKQKRGAVLIVDSDEKLLGIFTERDFILKVYGCDGSESAPVAEFMTPHPARESSSVTFAFILNLMSHGGFRHVPLVDDDERPVAVVGVKDVIDFIVEKMTQDILDIPLEE